MTGVDSGHNLDRMKEISLIGEIIRQFVSIKGKIMNRRDFLGLSAGLTLSLNNMTFSFDGKGEASVIFVWLGGGIAAQEFINPLPDSLSEYKSSRGDIFTKSGYHLGGDFVELAKISDKISVVPSFHHRDGNHESATAWVMTSHFTIPNQSPQAPSYGSLTSVKFGTNHTNGMPTYVKINPIFGDDAAYMGAKYMGYDADKEGVANLYPRTEQSRFDRRIGLMKEVDKGKISSLGQEWSQVKDQAVNIVRGAASKAFDLKNEPEKSYQEYGGGKSRFGTDCLLARRLVEGGAKFVTLVNNGWDMHTDISNGFANKGPELDKYLTVLISDVIDRGLNTLVVVTSEFSRTKKNQTGGRDHQPTAGTILFGGAGKHGRKIGSTDKTGLAVQDSPFLPTDLAWTIGSHLGIDKQMILTDNSGRPRHIFETNAKNILT